MTGASSGIGYELAAICAQEGFDLLVAADRPALREAAEHFRSLGATTSTVEADLSTTAGVDTLSDATAGRPVDALLASDVARVLAEQHARMAKPGSAKTAGS